MDKLANLCSTCRNKVVCIAALTRGTYCCGGYKKAEEKSVESVTFEDVIKEDKS
jgi:hypothetical protein